MDTLHASRGIRAAACAALSLLVAAPLPAQSPRAKRDIHGLAIGITRLEFKAALDAFLAGRQCRVFWSDPDSPRAKEVQLTCQSGGRLFDEYQIQFTSGRPDGKLFMISYTFFSKQDPWGVQDSVLSQFGLSPQSPPVTLPPNQSGWMLPDNVSIQFRGNGTYTVTLRDEKFVEDQRRAAEKAKKEHLDKRSPIPKL